ncbi:autophagy protein [Blyttiomyces sp. JEL0837]|nr:autophagy protein [Blyttiomyces sp. JEL0837]
MNDSSCISVGTRHGYKIYNCDPFGKFFSKLDGGIGVVEMLFCTSLVALVGAGEQPAFSPRRLQITNTKRMSTICELTFVTAILAVKLNRKRLIVVLEEHIYIYDIATMKLLHTLDTSPNPNALCVLSPSSENCFLAYPPNTSGSSGDLLLFDAISLAGVTIIPAHKSPLSCISFNYDGTMIATASDKGTVIRVFSVPTGAKLFQFRRGTYNTRIYSISFDLSSTLLAVSSHSDTVHIFKLSNDREKSSSGSQSSGNGSTGSDRASSTEKPSSTESKRSSGVLSAGLGTAERTLASVYTTFKSPIASATAAVGSYLIPDMITEMLEPQRDFAHAKLPAAAKGFQNISALGGSTTTPTSLATAGINPFPSSTTTTTAVTSASSTLSSNITASPVSAISPGTPGELGSGGSGGSLLGGAAQPRHLMVVTAAGFFYQYAIDLENGGECTLVKEHSLLEDDVAGARK